MYESVKSSHLRTNNLGRNAQFTFLLNVLTINLLVSAAPIPPSSSVPATTSTDMRLLASRNQLCGGLTIWGLFIEDVQRSGTFYISCFSDEPYTFTLTVYQAEIAGDDASYYTINMPPSLLPPPSYLIQNPITRQMFSVSQPICGFYIFSPDADQLEQPGSFAQFNFLSITECTAMAMFTAKPKFIPATDLLLIGCSDLYQSGLRQAIIFDTRTNMTVGQLNLSNVPLWAVQGWTFSTDGDELILAGTINVVLYNLTEIISQYHASTTRNSTSPLTLNGFFISLTALGCMNLISLQLDRPLSLLFASCDLDDTVHRWFISPSNEIIGPVNTTQSILLSSSYYSTPSCNVPYLHWSRMRRTLFLVCVTGSESFLALQEFDMELKQTPSTNVLVTSLVGSSSCMPGGANAMIESRLSPDAFFWLCYQGLSYTQGAAVTSAASNEYNSNYFTLPKNAHYDHVTDSIYVQYLNYPLARVHNREIHVLINDSTCLTTYSFPQMDNTLVYDPVTRSVLITCYNTPTLSVTNVSIDDPSHRVNLFSSDLFAPIALHGAMHFFINTTLAHSMIFVLSSYQIPPYVYIASYFNGTGLETFVVTDNKTGAMYNVSYLIECGEWIVFTDAISNGVGRVLPMQWSSAELLWTYNPNMTLFGSTLTCDPAQQAVYVIPFAAGLSQQLVSINLLNVTTVANYSFTTIAPSICSLTTLDQTLRLLYILCQGITQSMFIFHLDSGTITSTIPLAQLADLTIQSISADSYSGRVVAAASAASGYGAYDQLLVYSSGFRCAPGNSWVHGDCRPCPISTSRGGVISSFNSSRAIPQCLPCTNGTVAQWAGQIMCTHCAKGRFADTSVGQVCSFCNGGYYSNQTGSTSCLPCESGRFSNTSEASFCYSADPGSYVSVEGQSMQFQCPSGSFSNTSAAIECQQCDAGRYAANYGQSNCTIADIGYFVSLPGQNSPSQCPSGRFSNTSGLKFCYDCDIGTYTPLVGVYRCEWANPGSFVDQSGQTAEQQCPSGRYSNTTCATSCSPCEVGRYALAYGSVNCTLADEGYYIDHSGQSAQFQCPPGRYSNTTGLTSCYECDVGRYAAEYGRFNCTATSAGYYIDIKGQSAQIECSSGRFSNSIGSTTCTTCDLGRYSTKFGSKNCTEASEGFFVNQEGQNSQQPCSPGTFNNATGSTLCQPCVAGTFASLPSSIFCTECLLGQFSAEAASNCPTCSADAYTPQLGADCISCTDQEGLICINGLASVAAGWWAYLINDTSFDPPLYQIYRTTQCPPGYCDGATLQFASTSSNQTSQLCTPPRLNSHQNWLCAECESGYIAWGSSCQPCTGSNVGLICGALILSFVLVYILLRMDPSASPLTILVFFIQIAALELGSVTKWIDWIQGSNLGAHSFTHCLAPLTPIQQMILTLCVPFLLTLILGLMSVSHSLLSVYVTPSAWYQSAISSSEPSRFTQLLSWCSFPYNRDRYIGTISAILRFCYTSVTVTVVSGLHCVQVGPDTKRLFSTPSVDCHSSEYRTFLLPFVYVWLTCYVIGLPAFMFIFVWRRLGTVVRAVSDHSLSSNSGESMKQVFNNESLLSGSSINGSFPDDVSIQFDSSHSIESLSFHLRWGHLYRPYRVGAWYWQPIEMMQRFAFALVSILLIQHSSARYAFYGTLTIISLMLQLRCRPFVSDRLNQFAMANYFLLVLVSFLLSGQHPPYTLGVQIFFFLLIVPFSVTLFVWGFANTVIDLRASKRPPVGDPDSSVSFRSVNLQPSSSFFQHHPRASHDLAEPLLDSS